MGGRWSLLARVLSLVVSCVLAGSAAGGGLEEATRRSKPTSSEAYVTLVYGDDFVLGARVLGQSLRETGTARDMVALCTGRFSSASELTLTTDGWRVLPVSAVQNPGKGPQKKGFPAKFWVVFIDSDILVMRNMDVIFRCPGFCAALRHSERFNSGVMSLVPSQELYNDIMDKIMQLPSYTGGDQGFLNAYFSGFAHSPLFNPEANYTLDQYRYMRLPTSLNADVGLYVVNSNRWMIPRDSLYVIHYTLGPFKPWVWWSGWLVKENPAWQAMRSRLPPDAYGNHYGRTSRQAFAERWLVALPWVFLVFTLYYCVPTYRWKVLLHESSHLGPANGRLPHGGGVTSPGGRGKHGVVGAPAIVIGAEALLKLQAAAPTSADCFPRMFVPVSVAVGYGCVFIAVLATILLVPPEVEYVYGWLLSYEWGILIFGAFYSWFLTGCYNRGLDAGAHVSMQALKVTNERKPWRETFTSATSFFLSLLVAPFIGQLLGITSFVGNIVATVFVGLGLILLTTIHFMFLPLQWYLAGRLVASRLE